jgi:hypothetical protein
MKSDKNIYLGANYKPNGHGETEHLKEENMQKPSCEEQKAKKV